MIDYIYMCVIANTYFITKLSENSLELINQWVGTFEFLMPPTALAGT